MIKQPRSPVSEAFRSLRTNLEFSGVDKPLRTVLVTSAGPGEGKTTVSVNLAAIIAQGGKPVILLDTDMRRPQVHSFLNLPNNTGFSDLFRSNPSFRLVGNELGDLKDAVVITSGSPPPNPTELLGSDRMNHILNDLKGAAEVVILDSPPSIVADAQILAAKVDGVILVVHPMHTHADAALASVEQMKRAGARVLGVVLNRIPKNRSYYYGSYRYYYSPYYKSNKTDPKKQTGVSGHSKEPILNSFLSIFSTWRSRWKKAKPGSKFSLLHRTAVPYARSQGKH